MSSLNKQKLLLHCCCAPCTTSVLEKLSEEYSITLFFYNPNIRPETEYFKRADEMKKLPISGDSNSLTREPVSMILCSYESYSFDSIYDRYPKSPEGGARCRACFDLRLSVTALTSIRNGFDFFATTLSVSPSKNATFINEVGIKISSELYNNEIQFLEADFKKSNGFKRSIELSKLYGLYRQNYCGCRPIDT